MKCFWEMEKERHTGTLWLCKKSSKNIEKNKEQYAKIIIEEMGKQSYTEIDKWRI